MRRDVDRLRELGYPVDAMRGVAGGYQLQAGAALPPLLVDEEEAVAIAVGLRTAAAGAVAGIEETSVQALAKVVQVMPPRLRRRVDALQEYTVPAITGGGPAVDSGALTVIAQACRDDERLRFRYTRRDGEEAARHVEPNRLVSVGRRWYLAAWDLERGDWRTFRVDRLTEPRATGARFRPREVPGGDAAQFVLSQLASRPQRYDVSVRVNVAPAAVEPFERWVDVEPIDDESCRLRMSTDSLSWPAMILAELGASFTVESPDELRDYLNLVGKLYTRSTDDPTRA